MRVLLGCAWMLAAQTSLLGQTYVNLARGRTFTTSGSPYGNWSGLVDGVTDSDRPPYCFATDGSKQFPKWVVIDLGSICRISKINVLNSYNGNVRTVEIYCSSDGHKFEMLRKYIFPMGRLQPLSHSFQAREARYVKIAFRDTHGGGYGGDYYMYLREVEVWGRPGSGVAPPNASRRPRRDTTPRWLRIFRHYALRDGAHLKLAVIGDSVALPAPSADAVRPFGSLLADLLAEHLRESTDAEVAPQVQLTDLSTDRHALAKCLARLQEDVIAQEPDIVVVAVGVWATLEGDRDSYRDELNELVMQLLEGTHAAVILVTPPPIPADETKEFYDETRGKDCAWAAQTMQAVGELNDLPVLDLAQAFKETELDLAQLYEDNLHLNSVGHTIVAQRVFDLLR